MTGDSITFPLPTAAIDAARRVALSSDVRQALVLSKPVRGAMLRTVTCSEETAHELLHWFRASATAAVSDPAQADHARMCSRAVALIRAALDV